MGDGENVDQGTSSTLKIQKRNTDKPADAGVDARKEVSPWEREDAPAGSTEGSLLVVDENGQKRVSGPTHYSHMADGRIVGTYGISTHHTDADFDNGRPVAVAAHFAG